MRQVCDNFMTPVKQNSVILTVFLKNRYTQERCSLTAIVNIFYYVSENLSVRALATPVALVFGIRSQLKTILNLSKAEKGMYS
ncbi:hypothetical protein ccbrp13_35030 [Ktedonobacteria bacterium brp13]|nr:hypothetical protein ccbrp13_35030 [Ktedonobacteria bacterium brp13]